MPLSPSTPDAPSPQAAAFAGITAAMELQAAAARATLPHLARIDQARAGWLAELDVATDAGELEQLVGLAAEAPTEFALGWWGEGGGGGRVIRSWLVPVASRTRLLA